MSDNRLWCVPGDEALTLLNSMLAQGIAVRIRVVGRSMKPMIQANDHVVIEPITEPIRVGDIVLCRHPQAAVACIHRIVWRGRGLWRTKGDALKSLDPPVHSEQVLGRITAIEREGFPKRDLGSFLERVRAVAAASRSLGGAVLRRVFRRFYSEPICF